MLNNLRQELWTLRNNYDISNEALRKTKKNLVETLEELSKARKKLRWEKERHKNTSQRLDTERDAHEKTKQTLQQEQQEQDHERESERESMVAISAALAAVIIMLSLGLCSIYRYRKKLAIYCLSSNPGLGEATNNSLVVGRPVQAVDDLETVQNGKLSDKERMSRGVPTSSADDGNTSASI
mmetsp:Transcript_62791/g.112168  ORF Transcript_62791/g.112168 Transcript_62791/m.112168 type:complete len:182 (+) Transcript_62791:3-548(+)